LGNVQHNYKSHQAYTKTRPYGKDRKEKCVFRVNLLHSGVAALLHAALATIAVVVDLEVGGEMVAAGKGAAADFADIRPRASVLANVAGQLVGAGEAPVAAGPRAMEGALAGVGAGVGLEVRGLGVALAAPAVRAQVGAVLAVGSLADHNNGSAGRLLGGRGWCLGWHGGACGVRAHEIFVILVGRLGLRRGRLGRSVA